MHALKLIKLLFCVVLGLNGLGLYACDCGGVLADWKPESVQNSFAVARIRIDSMAIGEKTDCVVWGRGLELLWGDLPSVMPIVYDCHSSCAMSFLPGEEWLVYVEQNPNKTLRIQFCGRSRRRPAMGQRDEGVLASRIGFEEELAKIKSTFPVRKFMNRNEWDQFIQGKVRTLNERRIMPYPDRKEAAQLLAVSAAAFFLIWWVLKRFVFRQ